MYYVLLLKGGNCTFTSSSSTTYFFSDLLGEHNNYSELHWQKLWIPFASLYSISCTNSSLELMVVWFSFRCGPWRRSDCRDGKTRIACCSCGLQIYANLVTISSCEIIMNESGGKWTFFHIYLHNASVCLLRLSSYWSLSTLLSTSSCSPYGGLSWLRTLINTEVKVLVMSLDCLFHEHREIGSASDSGHWFCRKEHVNKTE